jgi:hypothetical protein
MSEAGAAEAEEAGTAANTNRVQDCCELRWKAEERERERERERETERERERERGRSNGKARPPRVWCSRSYTVVGGLGIGAEIQWRECTQQYFKVVCLLRERREVET